jgi:hypothetical protein
MEIEVGKIYRSNSRIFLVLSVLEEETTDFGLLYRVYKVIFTYGTIYSYYDYSTIILEAKNV